MVELYKIISNLNMIEKMEQKKVIFTPEEAEAFFQKNSFEFPKNMEVSKSIGCIDDRDPYKRIAIPGSSLGFHMAVFGAVDKLSINVKDKEGLCHLVSSVVGNLIHTDEDNIQKGESLPVAGCGHCSGILKRGELNSDFSDFLKSSYLKELETKMGKPLAYKGSHNAKGVFIINDLETGLISNDGTDQVFVYNKKFHQKLINDLVEKIYPFIQKINPNLKKEQFSETLKEVSEEQLQKTLDHLTQGLPFFEK